MTLFTGQLFTTVSLIIVKLKKHAKSYLIAFGVFLFTEISLKKPLERTTVSSVVMRLTR